MLYLKNVSESNDLLYHLALGEIVELGAGDYHLDTDQHFSLNLVSANPAATRIYLHQPLRVGYFSRLTDVTLIPDGDFAAVNLDKSSYSQFHRVHFNAPLPQQSSVKTHYRNLEHRGIGVETTIENDGENSYAVKFYNCLFQFLQIGLDLNAQQGSGTGGWLFDGCVLNGCVTGLSGKRINHFEFNRGLVQLCETGMYIDGNNNRIMFSKFERGLTDILIEANSYYNHLHFVVARTVINNGIETRIRLQKHRNIGRKS